MGAAAVVPAVGLALVLAVPDFGAVISGADADPVGGVLTTAVGSVGAGLVLMAILRPYRHSRAAAGDATRQVMSDVDS